jgi:hypothetical protein
MGKRLRLWLLISLSSALNGRQLEQAVVLLGRILLAVEEVQRREGEGKVQGERKPEPHSVLRRTM